MLAKGKVGKQDDGSISEMGHRVTLERFFFASSDAEGKCKKPEGRATRRVGQVRFASRATGHAEACRRSMRMWMHAAANVGSAR